MDNEIKLFLHQKETKSIFQLLGEKENHMTYSLGWVLSRSPAFIYEFLSKMNSLTVDKTLPIQILLQEYEKDKGFTDIEIKQENTFHIIIEAKRGLSLPTRDQLEKYATRSKLTTSNVKSKIILVLSGCPDNYVNATFKIKQIFNIPVIPISWYDVYVLAKKSITKGGNKEKQIITELMKYLKDVITMQDIEDNRVYVVSLGSGTDNGWKISRRDIVNKKMKYFHPIGINGWPATPPNYIAFRYDGILQSIHHIDKYEVFINPRTCFSADAPDEKWDPHYLYYLGPSIKPDHEVKTGKKIQRSARVWAMIDLLLTCKTIDDAREQTEIRKSKIQSGI